MKKIFLLSVFLLLTGCSANYDLQINNDGKIKESIVLNMANTIIDSNALNIPNKVNDRINVYKKFEIYSKYTFKYNITDVNTDVTATANYNSITEFKKSRFLNDTFAKVEVYYYNNNTKQIVINNFNYDSIYSNSSESETGIYIDKYTIEKVIIKIKSEKEVLKTNADIADTKNNIYTWEITPYTFEKEIKITYSNKPRYDIIIKDIFIEYSLIIIIYSIIIMIVSGIIIYHMVNTKNNNKI